MHMKRFELWCVILICVCLRWMCVSCASCWWWRQVVNRQRESLLVRSLTMRWRWPPHDQEGSDHRSIKHTSHHNLIFLDFFFNHVLFLSQKSLHTPSFWFFGVVECLHHIFLKTLPLFPLIDSQDISSSLWWNPWLESFGSARRRPRCGNGRSLPSSCRLRRRGCRRKGNRPLLLVWFCMHIPLFKSILLKGVLLLDFIE